LVDDKSSLGFIFAFKVLPTIIFFSALTSLLFYLGILQKVVFVIAWLMKKSMRLSGPESLAAAGNIFLGQTEAPLLVKPYIGKMSNSELFCLMTGGMATIAGGVLAAYISFLGKGDPEQTMFYARHLLAASIMAAPGAIVASKLLFPETEELDENVEVPTEKIGDSVLEAIAGGTVEGVKLAVNVAAMLLVFIALITFANYIFELLGRIGGLNAVISDATGQQYKGLSLQFLLGYLFAPLTWLLGVCKEDMVLVAQLLGEKTILNEFVAYVSLGNMRDFTGVGAKAFGMFHEKKSLIMATYMLCGFANFASIGIQIGGIGSLAPEKRSQLAKMGVRAMVGGIMASLFTATLVGMLLV
jgi:CNT family concentrative nucleoside transporter